MGGITRRRGRNGSISYRAQVRFRRHGVDHNESQTFTSKQRAREWIRQREGELEAPGGLARATAPSARLGDLVQRYIEMYGEVREWGRTKQEHLLQITRMDIADWDATQVTAGDLVDHVRRRRLAGTGPATVGNDLIWLGIVFRAAKGWGVAVEPQVVAEARAQCRSMQMVAPSKQRDRRPTDKELDALTEWFSERDGRARIPMVDIMWFAIYSARREAEITRLRWADNDPKTRTGLLRDGKHPRATKGNHHRFKYTKEAWEIVERQPTKEGEFIFPYNPKSVGAAFTRACHMLGIEDLRFHDLKHEATSRLFERGHHIHEVAQFTLHKSWSQLKRYSQLRPENLREL